MKKRPKKKTRCRRKKTKNSTMSRAPTGGDSDSDEDMDKEYQIELLYHAADAAGGEVQAERLRVDAKSTWPDVKKFAQQQSGHADFALEDEDGGRLGAQTPLAWIRADQQGRPYRRAVVKRRGVDADGVFERRGVVAPAHVGLVANTINAGMDTTTLLSESIENSVQHGATLVKIFIDPEARRIVIFDNGDGIRPEHIDVLAKAGASTVRDDDIQAPVRGALVAHEAAGGRGGRSQGSRSSAYGHREFGRLRAEWGRYGVGRYAQLNGTETKVRFVSVAKGVTKLIVFEQDMAEMAHQKTITYDYRVYDHGTRECARAINDVNKLVRDDPDPTYQPSPDDPDALDQFLRKKGVGDQSFMPHDRQGRRGLLRRLGGEPRREPRAARGEMRPAPGRQRRRGLAELAARVRRAARRGRQRPHREAEGRRRRPRRVGRDERARRGRRRTASRTWRASPTCGRPSSRSGI